MIAGGKYFLVNLSAIKKNIIGFIKDKISLNVS